MIKKFQLHLFLIALIGMGCGEKERLTMKAIDADLNERFITGKGLDPSYFSIQNVRQYYVVEGYEPYSGENLAGKLDDFVWEKYRHNLDQFLQLQVVFYKDHALSNYGNRFYEQVRDSDNGLLEGQHPNLLASFRYIRQGNHSNTFVRHANVYLDEKVYSKVDTIHP